MSCVNEKGLEALDKLCDDTAEFGVAGIGDRLKAIRDIVKGLIGSGAVSAGGVWAWIPVILQLLQELGPLVQEIVDRIREAIGKGQTPQTFAA